jgi:hypothetical protein
MALKNTLFGIHNQYVKGAVVGILAALILGAAYMGYRWYSVHREQGAHTMFADCMQSYLEAHAKQESWENVEQLCKQGYEKNKRSDLAPFFLGLQAEALLQQHKQQEAADVLHAMNKAMPGSSSVAPLYGVKEALINLDNADEKIQEKGLEQLKSLANNNTNNNRDVALYYVGLYYWSTGNLEQARESWQTLMDVQQDNKMAQSPWAQLAEPKLQSIS